ncbi:MAG: transposase, partial [Gammaproteobacteria bacterium]
RLEAYRQDPQTGFAAFDEAATSFVEFQLDHLELEERRILPAARECLSHAFASSAKFSSKFWEFDLGWVYIRLLVFLGLARVKKVAPRPAFNRNKAGIDFDTVSAVISGRLYVMAYYARDVVSQVYKEEKAKADAATKKMFRQGKRLITKADFLMDETARQRLEALLEQSDALQVVYEFRQRLQILWLEKNATRESLIQGLQEWCQQAEESGIVVLQDFSQTLRGYTLQSA